MRTLMKKLKQRINAYLERMAEANKKNFGNQRLDCCSLNKHNHPH